MNKSQQAAFDQWLAEMVKNHRMNAAHGTWDGKGLTPYYMSCRQIHLFRGVCTILTRDVGYHSSGWWKNPDFERCLHLSISFFDPVTQQQAPHDHEVSFRIVRAMFFPHAKLVWQEGPYSETGKSRGVWHYRLFCDEAWNPIKPRGEVYSTELTEAGWKSFSDVQEAMAETGVNPNTGTKG